MVSGRVDVGGCLLGLLLHEGGIARSDARVEFELDAARGAQAAVVVPADFLVEADVSFMDMGFILGNGMEWQHGRGSLVRKLLEMSFRLKSGKPAQLASQYDTSLRRSK